MSDSRWVTTPLWFSKSLRHFLYSSSVYSCYLFLISSASVRSLPFLSFIVPIFAWNIPLVSLIFLKRSLVFPIILLSSIFLHYSLKKALLSLLGILWNSAFSWVYISLWNRTEGGRAQFLKEWHSPRAQHKLIKIKWSKMADNSTLTRPFSSISKLNDTPRGAMKVLSHHHKTKKWMVAQFLEISTPSPK